MVCINCNHRQSSLYCTAIQYNKTPFEWNSKGIYVGNKTRAYIRMYTVNLNYNTDKLIQSQCPASLSIVLEFERVNTQVLVSLSFCVNKLRYVVPFNATFIILLFNTIVANLLTDYFCLLQANIVQCNLICRCLRGISKERYDTGNNQKRCWCIGHEWFHLPKHRINPTLWRLGCYAQGVWGSTNWKQSRQCYQPERKTLNNICTSESH